MAKSFVSEVGTVKIPGAYSRYKVVSNPAGLATTGVLMLVGEADAGPDFTQEDDIEENAFGPDQLADVVGKYGSGNIVDAFRAAVSAANDPDIIGSFSRAIIVKTNVSAKASAALAKSSDPLETYGTLYDKNWGKAGNQISYKVVEQVAEVSPTTGTFTWIPNVSSVSYGLVASGITVATAPFSANTSPATFVSTVNALSPITATGGAVVSTIQASVGTLAVSGVSGNSATFTYSGVFTTTPTVGQTLVIPSTSVIKAEDPDVGDVEDNVGAYIITSATSNTIVATKLSDAGRTGAAAGVITPPVAADAIAVSITPADDFLVYDTVVVSLDTSAVIDGVGKSLEIAEVSGSDVLSNCTYQSTAATPTKVTWVSKTGSAKLLTATEYKVKLQANRATDAVSEEIIAGGEIGLRISYVGTSASLTIDDSTFTTTVSGGAGTGVELDLADYPTIQSLADYVNSLPGYACAPSTGAVGLLPSTALDDVTLNIVSHWGALNGRVKTDAFRFFQKVSEESVLVQLGDPAEKAVAGLPASTSAFTYLAGGTKGATTNEEIVDGIAALENVFGNFLVPLFSRDATLDIQDELTDAASTYTIAAVHAAAKSHVLAMSAYKKRKNRQAFLSISDVFETQKTTAANIASFRCSMAFQDFKQLGGDGSIVQFQPWMGATLAAGMQAAAFYKNIEFKGINTSGVLHGEGDFNAKSDSQVEEALDAGLLPARRARTGGFIFISDQSTYGKDSNAILNSIQAVYAADTIALTTAERMESAFVGQSTADISAAIALSFLDGIMGEMFRLKLIAASDDAPRGYKNAKIQISGNVMKVSLEVKLATAIDFIDISFLVSTVQQTAQ